MSVNLFSLLCNGNQPVSASSLGQLKRFGGPILYLIVYGLILFGILVWWDSGAVLPFKGWRSRNTLQGHTPETNVMPADVAAEANAVAYSQDSLRVVNVTKVYGGNTVVDRVSFGVAQGDVLALLGPNGAGKTTTFNMIRGFTNLRDPLDVADAIHQEAMFRRRTVTSLSMGSRLFNTLVARDSRWVFALSSQQLTLN